MSSTVCLHLQSAVHIPVNRFSINRNRQDGGQVGIMRIVDVTDLTLPISAACTNQMMSDTGTSPFIYYFLSILTFWHSSAYNARMPEH